MKTHDIVITIGLCSLMATSVFADVKPMSILYGEFKTENNQSVRKSVAVKTLEYRPSSSGYVVRGRVRHQNVEGDAFLEMWNVMPDGSRYFSRTLADSGPMRKIQGTGDWREFEIPFNLMDATPESVTLEINVVMPGKGTIELSDLTVGDFQSFQHGQVWWSKRTSGIVGGLLGTFAGIYGGLLGCLCGLLTPRGKGRRLITWFFVFGIVAGAIFAAVGLAAQCFSQPFHVWYPFYLVGCILGFLSPVFLSVINRVYSRIERRRMEALDI